MVPGEQGTLRRLTGGYYWFPMPVDGSVAWDVLTCHELGFDSEVGHIDLWPSVVDRLAAAWRRDASTLLRKLQNAYTGLPRGRVTRPGSRSLILHGNDAPVPHWLPRVLRQFDLDRRSVRMVLDEHERMLAEDRRMVEDALGQQLGRDGKRTPRPSNPPASGDRS